MVIPVHLISLKRRCVGVARISLTLTVVVAPAACGAPPGDGRPEGAAAPPAIRLAQSDEGVVLLEALRESLARAAPGVALEVLDSGAGVINLHLLQRGEVDVASTFADIAYMASIGQLPDMPEPFHHLRAIAALPVRELQVLVAAGSGIQSIRDLRGRRVSLGPPGTGIALTAELLLRAFGIDAGDIRGERLAFERAAHAIVAREIDVAFWGGRFPNANIATALSQGAQLLQVVGPEIDRFREEYPFLRAIIIPPGAHPGLERSVHTVGVDRILVCRADLDERVVHALTTAYFQAVTTAGRGLRMYRGFQMGRAAATPLPLHPGAARYYRELEMRR